jgi:SAM-dependent methyltransferase
MGETPDPLPTENTTPNTHNVVAELLLGHDRCRRVLDIPCGEGAFTQRCLARGLAVSAADCVPFDGLNGADFAIADMNRTLPYDDDTFDAAVCIDGIEHIERPFDFIRQCARVVRPGGAVILSTPNISALRSRWRWLLTGFHAKCKSPLDEANIRTNRCKLISLAYAVLAPLSWLVTLLTLLRSERRSPEGRRRNREILGQMFTGAALFGETLIVMARNDKAPAHDRRPDQA